MDNKETLTQNNARLANINKVLEKAVFPSGTLTITKNGSYDVKNYETVSALIEGGSWGGEYDLTLTWNYEDDMGNNIGDTTMSGYVSIDNGDPVYFEDMPELVLTEAVNAYSTVTVYCYTTARYPTVYREANCLDVIWNQSCGDDDYPYGLEIIITTFTGDASVRVGLYN